MPETRSWKTKYLAVLKRKIVEKCGCEKCHVGRMEEGFAAYWYDDQYIARRFVFKYTDPRGLDVPVAKLPRLKDSTKETIDHALARCVILCRSCADPRRTRKDDQCQKTTTESSPPNS